MEGANAINQNCITGEKDYLYHYLKESVEKAIEIDMNVSFLMESGVKLILDDLLKAVNRGVKLRILCGNYLNITQPQALYLLKDNLGDEVDLRFYNISNRSFHPKAYFFKYDNYDEVYVGSSNISRSALTQGIEWNYRINSIEKKDDCDYFKSIFEELFKNHSKIIDDLELRNYSKQWTKPKVIYQIEENEEKLEVAEKIKEAKKVAHETEFPQKNETMVPEVISFPQPIGAQIEALYELKNCRSDNLDKGIVVAATGVGKTFLAAFDSRAFKRILFVAHRDEILGQAEQTFKCVRDNLTTGQFNGIGKELNADIIFASVQTLGNTNYLNDSYFAPDAFDYIVIDEFHHAVADCYQNILDYFKPKFLLGLTATPERLDNQDVFALCDYNIIYEVRLKEAINKGWLVPFRYYGIYDEIDYNEVRFKNGKYNTEALEKLASINKRGNLIFQNYCKYNSKRALGFCINRNHAFYMTEYFRNKGIKCCAIVSGTIKNNQKKFVMDRKDAIQGLKRGDLQIVFSVDIFNEGLDIRELDMVLFLRPTQSPTIFLQQLGRGLRKAKGKKYLNVLDFIGNYKKANLVPFLLTSEVHSHSTKRNAYQLPKEDAYTEDCYIDFDFRLIDLFKKMAAEQKKIMDLVTEEYFRIESDLNKKPLRLEMYVNMDPAIYQNIRTKKKQNIFKDYLSFLSSIGKASEAETKIMGTVAHDFLKKIENTQMSKTYKMPIFLAFYNDGKIKKKISTDDIYKSFKNFYEKGSNRIDLLRDKSTADVLSWRKEDYVSLANRNPIKFLLKAASDYFYKEDDLFCLTEELNEYFDDPVFVRHFKDIIDYRTKRFYKERLEKLEK
jgi:superfamily II DNA or RNA helicase